MDSNRILFYTPLTFRDGKTRDGKQVFIQDVSSCQFFIEELIILAVTDLVVPASQYITTSFEGLPSILTKRISIVDQKDRASKSAEAVMAPIKDEFEFPNDIKIRNRFSREQIDDLYRSIISLEISLTDFLIASEYKLQFEISLSETMTSIKTLRDQTRSPNARTSLAILNALFDSYKEVKLDTILSNASGRFRDLFEQFIQEETYRQMAEQSSLLAIPGLVKRAVSTFGRLSRRLLEREDYRGLLTATSKVVGAATHLPLPDSELAHKIVQRNYMPPIVSLIKERERAAATWEKLTPPIRPVKDLKTDMADYSTVQWSKYMNLDPFKMMKERHGG